MHSGGFEQEEGIPVAEAFSFPKSWCYKVCQIHLRSSVVLFFINVLTLNSFILCRKGLQRVLTPPTETSLDYLPNRAGVFDTANLILRLLRSKDGVVLRRLLMTAVSDLKLNLFSLLINYYYHTHLSH